MRLYNIGRVCMKKIEFRKFLLMSILVFFITSILWTVRIAFKIESIFNVFLVLVPLILIGILFLTPSRHSNFQYFDRINMLSTLLFSILLYLCSLYFLDKSLIEVIIIPLLIVLTTLLIIFILTYKRNKEINNGNSDSTKDLEENKNYDEKLFIIYYLNFLKTYELVMLIDNRIKTNENSEFSSVNSSFEESLTGFNLGMKKNSINLETNYSSTITNSEKMLENFEFKNTKSNYLKKLLNTYHTHNSKSELKEGDIVKFSNISLALDDQKETIDSLKLLVGGALNGMNIKSQEKGFNFEMDMSSLLNSFISECVYELSFTNEGKNYYICIPLTGNDDFENKYTVNDLLIGKVTILGVYKGAYRREKPLINKLMGNNSEKIVSKMQRSGETQSKSNEFIIEDGVASNSQGNIYYIDIIAIVQEIEQKRM